MSQSLTEYTDLQITSLYAFKFFATLMFLAAFTTKVYATAGFAEWEVPTPLGHEINHGDPYIGTEGTSLRRSPSSESEGSFIDHIEEWIFYPGYVVGKCRKGYFIFDEIKETVELFENEPAQRARMEVLKLNNSISTPYTGDKGWRQSWTRITNPEIHSYDELLKRTLADIEKQEYFQKLSTEQKELQRNVLKQRIEADIAYLRNEADFLKKALSSVETFPEYQKLDSAQRDKIKKYLQDRLKNTSGAG